MDTPPDVLWIAKRDIDYGGPADLCPFIEAEMRGQEGFSLNCNYLKTMAGRDSK